MRARVFVVLAALAAVVAALGAIPASWADQRLETSVDVSLRPIKPDGETRYYKVAGRAEPVFWDPVLPVVKGDVLEVRVLPTSGERPLSLCQLRLNGRALETFRSGPPYEAAVDTASLAEGWHLIEAFCQQEDSHPLRASGSVRFLVVRTLEDPGAEERIRTLEQIRVALAQQAAQREQEYRAEMARLSAEQAEKVARWQEAIATRVPTEPIAAGEPRQPAGGFILQGALTAGGGTSIGTTPTGKTVVLTGALTSGLGTPAAPVELTAPPTELRPVRPPTVSAQVRVRGGAAGEKVVLLFKRGDKVLLEKQYQLFANGSLLLPVQLPADVKVFIRWADGRVTPAEIRLVAKSQKGGMQ